VIIVLKIKIFITVGPPIYSQTTCISRSAKVPLNECSLGAWK